MKPFLKIFIAIFLSSICMAASASAITISFDDKIDYWLDYRSNIDSQNELDLIGSRPHVGTTTIIMNDDRNLQSISIEVEGRVRFDSLFINTRNDHDSTTNIEGWDYYVKAGWLNEGANGEGVDTDIAISKVDEDYTYGYTVGADDRQNHPNQIASGLIDFSTISIKYDGNKLTYDFSTLVDSPIVLGDDFIVGYTPRCANDVTMNPVPEPTTMFLLGSGLIGLAITMRRRKNSQ